MYVSELKETSEVRKLALLVSTFLKQVPPTGAPKELETQADIFSDLTEGSAFVIQSGNIEVELAGKLIYFYEPGDFIARPQQSTAKDKPKFKCTQDVTLQAYNWEDIKRNLQENPEALDAWTEYQTTFNSILVQALAYYSSHSRDPVSDYINFDAGDTIIAQGDVSDMVFTLMEGSAEAFQDGIKVGDIYEDEIFGAMAAFTNSERTASVVANDFSTVRAIKQDDFVELVRLQPEICKALIENMARQIVDLNDTILSMQAANEPI